jgi:hypothetical protein
LGVLGVSTSVVPFAGGFLMEGAWFGGWNAQSGKIIPSSNAEGIDDWKRCAFATRAPSPPE